MHASRLTPRLLCAQLQEEPKLPSLLTLMKGFIGKDLNTPLPLPVGLTEPSTEIMKRAEDIEYSELLDEVGRISSSNLISRP